MSHIREVVGADNMLLAYNAAREVVRSARQQRKQKKSLQVWDAEGFALCAPCMHVAMHHMMKLTIHHALPWYCNMAPLLSVRLVVCAATCRP